MKQQEIFEQHMDMAQDGLNRAFASLNAAKNMTDSVTIPKYINSICTTAHGVHDLLKIIKESGK